EPHRFRRLVVDAQRRGARREIEGRQHQNRDDGDVQRTREEQRHTARLWNAFQDEQSLIAAWRREICGSRLLICDDRVRRSHPAARGKQSSDSYRLDDRHELARPPPPTPPPASPTHPPHPHL